MRVVVARPPCYDLVASKFKIAGLPVLFAYGDVIYDPTNCGVSPHLMAHEQAHGQRQATVGVEEWWRRYVEDDEFRLQEEVIAHRVEYQIRLAIVGSNRLNRRRLLILTAQRLANPIYQYRVSVDRARALIKNFDEVAVRQEAAA